MSFDPQTLYRKANSNKILIFVATGEERAVKYERMDKMFLGEFCI